VSDEPIIARPSWVREPQEIRRWDLCVGVVERIFADEEKPASAEDVWFAARSLYKSDLPTE
jgi:hypothetical protein